ncbi:4606_t:CDS:2, partial [Paraglomus occultum]
MEEATTGVSTALRTCHPFYDSENPFLSADSPLRLRKSSEYEKKSKDKLSDNESDGDDEWVDEDDAANKENTTPRARRIATPTVLPSPYIQNDTTTPPLPFGVPLKGINTPVQNVDTPVKVTSVPVQDINTPVQGSNETPTQDMTASAQNMSTPTRKRTQYVTTPVQDMKTPVQRISTPVRGINTPLQVVRQGISITPSRSSTSSPRRKQMRSTSRRVRVRRVQRVNPAVYDMSESWYIKVGSRLSIYAKDVVCMLKHTCNVVWM